ncbi:MAG: ABC transporter substrate-binding protein, partial [Gammaproteobacteria bacterium]|nr:ABC transporter substrate-binding protein [Gammaproteobacteria bacterium]
GFLKQEGLEFEWSVSPAGKPATESIVDGSADLVQSAPSQAFNAIARGETDYPRHFAQINEMDGFFITGRAPDPDFSWQKLEGAEVVMFGGGQPNAMFRYACHRAGIDYDSIQAITPGGADDIDQAFRAGQGQYVQQQGPYPQQLAQENIGSVVAQVGPQIGPCAFSSLAASQEWLQTDSARAFTRAYAATRQFLNQAPAAEICAIQQAWFPGVDSTALESCISSYQKLGCWTPHIEITRPAFDVILDIFEYCGGISERHPYEMVCDPAPTDPIN